MKAYIGVGSNILPKENVISAMHLLNKIYQVTAASTFYFTPPLKPSLLPPENLDSDCQADFLNGLWSITTDDEPSKIIMTLKLIEKNLGRVRTQNRYASRTIDLDLIYAEGIVNPFLKIPDPDIYHRYFLALPLAELDPSLIMNDTGQSILSIIKNNQWSLENTEMKPDLIFSEELKEIIRFSKR